MSFNNEKKVQQFKWSLITMNLDHTPCWVPNSKLKTSDDRFSKLNLNDYIYTNRYSTQVMRTIYIYPNMTFLIHKKETKSVKWPWLRWIEIVPMLGAKLKLIQFEIFNIILQGIWTIYMNPNTTFSKAERKFNPSKLRW